MLVTLLTILLSVLSSLLSCLLTLAPCDVCVMWLPGSGLTSLHSLGFPRHWHQSQPPIGHSHNSSRSDWLTGTRGRSLSATISSDLSFAFFSPGRAWGPMTWVPWGSSVDMSWTGMSTLSQKDIYLLVDGNERKKKQTFNLRLSLNLKQTQEIRKVKVIF